MAFYVMLLISKSSILLVSAKCLLSHDHSFLILYLLEVLGLSNMYEINSKGLQ